MRLEESDVENAKLQPEEAIRVIRYGRSIILELLEKEKKVLGKGPYYASSSSCTPHKDLLEAATKALTKSLPTRFIIEMNPIVVGHSLLMIYK